mmetsp:Transcript_50419/g.153325  ORF Transcript_50419/g.153325 Transcript_50419/m.153325 type:complete len:266 (+) Transcript_50419:1172-1969(+)
MAHVLPVHHAVPHLHADGEDGALRRIGAPGGVVPALDGLHLGLHVVVGIVVVQGLAHQHLGEGDLRSEPLACHPQRGRRAEEVSQPAGIHDNDGVADRAAQQHHRVEAGDQAVLQRVVQQRHGDHVKNNVPEKVELAQLEGQVHVRRREHGGADNDEHVEHLSANDGTDADVRRVEDRYGVQRHLRAVAPQRHQRGARDVVGDLEALADDLDGPDEIHVADVGHAPEEVQYGRPPQPAQVRQVELDVLVCEAHWRRRIMCLRGRA